MNASRHSEMNAVSQLGHATRLSLAVLVSAFGPYLSASVGLRLDHVVVYGLLIGTCAAVLTEGHLVLKRPVWATLALWGGALVYMLTVTLLFGEAQSSRAVIAALETQTQPFALILILSVALRRLTGDECRNLAAVVSITIIVTMCMNAVLALASVYMDTSGVISYFVTTNAAGASVSSSAASMGRYSGMFNQPAEAGVAYSVAILSWVYLIITRGVRRWSLNLSLILLVAGGLLTVSKVFVLGGLPLAITYGLWVGTSSSPSRMGRLMLWGGMSSAAIMSLSGWAGWEYLMRFFGAAGMDPGGLLRMYTAGRYGQVGISAQGLFERTMQEAPLRGFGLGSYSPLDSGYIESFYQGGAVALLLHIGVLAVLIVQAIRSTSLHIGEGRLQLMLLALVLGGNFGISVLTANRASTILWVFLLVLTHASLQAALEQRQSSLGFRVTTVGGWTAMQLNGEGGALVASRPVGESERIDPM